MSRTTHHVPWRRRVVDLIIDTCECPSRYRCRCPRTAAVTGHQITTQRRRRRRSSDGDRPTRDGQVTDQVTRTFASYRYSRAFRGRDAAERRSILMAGTRAAERDALRAATKVAAAAARHGADWLDDGLDDWAGGLDVYVPPTPSALHW